MLVPVTALPMTFTWSMQPAIGKPPTPLSVLQRITQRGPTPLCNIGPAALQQNCAVQASGGPVHSLIAHVFCVCACRDC